MDEFVEGTATLGEPSVTPVSDEDVTHFAEDDNPELYIGEEVVEPLENPEG